MNPQQKFYLQDAKTGSYIKLSRREVDCIVQVLSGKRAKQIGKQLQLSHRTIEFYLSRLKTKLACHTLSELTEKLLSATLISRDGVDSMELQAIRGYQQIHSMLKSTIRATKYLSCKCKSAA
jgi:DNA-binding CsgD family transcriptional regulator